jgi:hypothetical protein
LNESLIASRESEGTVPTPLLGVANNGKIDVKRFMEDGRGKFVGSPAAVAMPEGLTEAYPEFTGTDACPITYDPRGEIWAGKRSPAMVADRAVGKDACGAAKPFSHNVTPIPSSTGRPPGRHEIRGDTKSIAKMLPQHDTILRVHSRTRTAERLGCTQEQTDCPLHRGGNGSAYFLRGDGPPDRGGYGSQVGGRATEPANGNGVRDDTGAESVQTLNRLS